MKKIISGILSGLMMLTIGTVGISAKNYDVDETSKVTTYNETTDVNELLHLVSKKYTSPKTMSNTDENENNVQVEQLLERKEMKDGTVEEKFVVNGLVLTDEMGIPLDKQATVREAVNNAGSDTKSSVTVVTSMYMTRRRDAYKLWEYRLDSVNTRIIKAGSVSPVSGNQGYRCQRYNISKKVGIGVQQSVSVQEFNVYGNGQFYQGYDHPVPSITGWIAHSDVNLSNGQNLYVETVISPLMGWEP